MSRRLLRTKVASRILGLFFVGAIVPVVVLQLLSFRAVSDLLEGQSEDRLAQLADATVQIVLERLASSTSWVASAGRLVVAAGAGSVPTVDSVLPPGSLASSLAGLAVTTPAGLVTSAGRVGPLEPLDDEERARLDRGQAIIRQIDMDHGQRLVLAMPLGRSEESILWAELEADSVWASAMVLGAGPRVADMCILDADLRPFACKGGPASVLPERLRATEVSGLDGLVRFDGEGEEQLAAWKRVYLRSAYGIPEWIVVVSESETSVHAPVAAFAYNLPLALAVGTGLVLLLANVLVSRTMGPLEKLTEGTERIARHDLDARVEVEGDDEFGALASSFNTMAERLSSQFAQLEAAQAIGRAVIEDNDASEAIGALIDGLESLSPGSRSAVVFIETTVEPPVACLYRRGPAGLMVTSAVDPGELAALDAAVDGDHAVVSTRAPEVFLGAGIGDRGGEVLLVRMVVQDSLVGFVAVEASRGSSGGHSQRVRRLIGQAGVALNENRLRRELVEFSDETLRALANAIDAKSRWTTGHSERVTDLAGAIGRRLGLGAVDLDILHRGGLLHDIGKIGVSTTILDHPGTLDRDQRRAVEAHAVIGHRILEPVRVFRPLLPIVLYHHERWDGEGYPEGLRANDIPYLARVLAVADVFDALASPRPYRGALSVDVVVEHIRSESGRAFDPRMVEAFDAVLADGWVHEVPEEDMFLA